MNKYIKFYFIVLAFLVWPYYMAITSDTFGTMVATFPAFLFFFFSLISSLVKALRKKETKYHLIKTISNLLLLPSLIIPAILSDHGLRELTQQRIQIIKELRPTFVKYDSENGHFPKLLVDLVPTYIQKIPNELKNDGEKDSYKKIYYELKDGQPMFYFRTIRGPDSAASLNVLTGEYWHDK